MLSGINIFCFTASYALALGLEVSRLFFNSRARSAIMIGFAAAGILAHTVYLGYRASGADRSPLSSPFDWYLLVAWTLAAVYVLLLLMGRRTAIGVFMLPLILILIGVGQFADQEPFAPERASRLWANIHGTFLMLGTVTVLVGFLAGLMYLVQSYRLKHKMLPTEGFRLPSLESLERTNSRALLASVLLIGIGFFAGIILVVIRQGRIAWTDPVVWTSALMFLWLVVAAVFNFSYPAARRGRKVAYLTVASFVFLALTLASILLDSSQHSVTGRGAASTESRGPATDLEPGGAPPGGRS